MAELSDFTIVIQAGGRSSRMGQDKALMPFLGSPLIGRQVARLRSLSSNISVITNRPQDYAFLGLPCFPDLMPGEGPLGGLLTALNAVDTGTLAVLACDLPFIMPALLVEQHRLLMQGQYDAVIPRSPDGPEPLHAVYRRERCLAAVQAALEVGERRMTAWFSMATVYEMSQEEVAVIDPKFYSFINTNSPEEFSEAEALAQKMGDW